MTPMVREAFSGADRGSTSPLTTVLTAAITTVLISGLIVAGGNLVEDQRHETTERQFETVGERLVEELVRAEQLGGTGTNVRVSLTTDHVEQVAGSGYTVELSAAPSCPGDADGCLTLRSADRTVEVTIPFDSDAAVDPASAPGGSVRVVYDGRLTIEGVSGS